MASLNSMKPELPGDVIRLIVFPLVEEAATTSFKVYCDLRQTLLTVSNNYAITSRPVCDRTLYIKDEHVLDKVLAYLEADEERAGYVRELNIGRSRGRAKTSRPSTGFGDEEEGVDRTDRTPPSDLIPAMSWLWSREVAIAKLARLLSLWCISSPFRRDLTLTQRTAPTWAGLRLRADDGSATARSCALSLSRTHLSNQRAAPEIGYRHLQSHLAHQLAAIALRRTNRRQSIHIQGLRRQPT